MPREYIQYKAHKLRKGIVHSSDDELVVITGDLAVQPQKKVKYILEYPAIIQQAPGINIRFIPEKKIPSFIRGCKDGEYPIPPDFDDYPAPHVSVDETTQVVELTDDRPGRIIERWQVLTDTSAQSGKIKQMHMSFYTEKIPGAYVFYVKTGQLIKDSSGYFTVVVYNNPESFFPEHEDDDLTRILGLSVNLSVKNGLLWFLHPMFFTEQMLNIQLSDQIKKEMVNCKDLPKDLPAEDKVITGIIWGKAHQGIKKIRLDVDEQEDICPKTQNIQVMRNTFNFPEFIKDIQ